MVCCYGDQLVKFQFCCLKQKENENDIWPNSSFVHYLAFVLLGGYWIPPRGFGWDFFFFGGWGVSSKGITPASCIEIL